MERPEYRRGGGGGGGGNRWVQGGRRVAPKVSGHTIGEDGKEGLTVAGKAEDDGGHVAEGASAAHDPHMFSQAGEGKGVPTMGMGAASFQ